MGFLALFLAISTAFSSPVPSLYEKRDFDGLILMSKDSKTVNFLKRQREDLKQCRFVRSGDGDLKSVLICMRFLAREDEFGWGKAASRTLFGEMDGLCSQIVNPQLPLQNVLDLEFPWGSRSLKIHNRCRAKILELARDKIAALGENRPVQAWALYQKTISKIPVTDSWKKRVLKEIGPAFE